MRGITGCTLLSCDNIRNNGSTIRRSLFNYVEKIDPELLPWLRDHVSCPNTTVDRITPLTRTSDIEGMKQQYSLLDQSPVVSESFSSWIIEDTFFDKRPPLDLVGVQFVKNIQPYEDMKLYLLNAGHSILGILGSLLGYKMVHEAANDPDLIQFLIHYMDLEVSPGLKDAETISVQDYKATLISRFKNAHINDGLDRICAESSSKIPLFVLPTLRAQLQTHQNIEGAAFLIAAWCKYNDEVNDLGEFYEISDTMSNTLIRRAALSHQDPLQFLKISAVFGDLTSEPIFTRAYTQYLSFLNKHPSRLCLQNFIKNS